MHLTPKWLLSPKHTMMLVAMTLGSSHTDSMKKIYKKKEALGLALVSKSLKQRHYDKRSDKKKITNLEVVFSTKLQDHVSSFSGCVCSIKNLQTVSDTGKNSYLVYFM